MKFLSLCRLIVFALIVAATSATAAEYGEKVQFRKDVVIKFPNFSVTYLGQHRVEVPVFKPGFLYYDFLIESPGGSKKTVSWTSGTGVIDARDFEMGGKPYCLELKGSVGYPGWLKNDELVIWPLKEFQAAARKKSGAN
jgi:hypothetical protein